ncbi:RNA polymerase sigma factor [Lunatimonas salinarum]|uniref:RNA polymerase sigma factor n=1 Tax=Lunatimonas salinarum TaxID=1774590 RepID=UPI001AE0125A|nr:sigma-70 family RNA polymerase sigma factor [Lunatimonas salinarum]
MIDKKKKVSDQEILRAIRSKERIEDAVSFLYREYYGFLENCIRRKSGTADDAADIIQETFLAFIDIVSHGRYREEASVKSLLYSIANNLWISEIRKRISRERRNAAFDQEQDVQQEDISHHMEAFENKKRIIDLFSSLGEACRDLLLKFYYMEMSIREIMQTGSFSSEQVLRNKKHLCLKRLTDRVTADSNLSRNIKQALQDE